MKDSFLALLCPLRASHMTGPTMKMMMMIVMVTMITAQLTLAVCSGPRSGPAEARGCVTLLFCCMDGPRTSEEAAGPQSAIVHTRHVRIRAVSTKALKTAHASKSCPNGTVKPGPWEPLLSPGGGLNCDLRDKPLCPRKTDMHPAVSKD